MWVEGLGKREGKEFSGVGFLGVKLKEAAVPCRHPRRGGRWGAGTLTLTQLT